jgi:hypothetical protein
MVNKVSGVHNIRGSTQNESGNKLTLIFEYDREGKELKRVRVELYTEDSATIITDSLAINESLRVKGG